MIGIYKGRFRGLRVSILLGNDGKFNKGLSTPQLFLLLPVPQAIRSQNLQQQSWKVLNLRSTVALYSSRKFDAHIDICLSQEGEDTIWDPCSREEAETRKL